MKRIGTGVLLLLAVTGVVALAAPRLEVDEAIHEFGSVLEGMIVVHRFVLTNTGDETLAIEDIKVWCGCTHVPELATDRLPPGASAELEVQLDTAGLPSEVTKSITVVSNDPEKPDLALQLIGTVRRAAAYHIGVGELDRLYYLVVDLRPPDAYAAAHLLGAINIPYDEIGEWVDRLPRGVLLVFYDEDGIRSDDVVQTLGAAFYPDARSLLGGLAEWRRRYGDRYVLSLP